MCCGGMSLGLRVITGNNLTSLNNLSPDVGMKWKILYILVNLNAGSGTGTREVQVLYSAYNHGPTGSPYGLVLADTGALTGSGIAQGGIIGTANSTVTSWNNYPILEHTGIINFQLTLISGDTFSFTLLVDEEADF